MIDNKSQYSNVFESYCKWIQVPLRIFKIQTPLPKHGTVGTMSRNP